MSNKLFIDTWGWLKIFSSSESRHLETLRYYRMRRESGTRMYTTDYVVDETITLLTIRTDVRRSLDAYDGIETAANSGFLRFERITEPRFQATLDLRRRYADKPDISFTDLSSMVVMEERGIRDVLSGDAHFEHVGLGFRRRPEPET